jgi:hypothetical protein
MAKILTKNSFIAGSAPSGLSAGELAVNVIDKKLYVGNAVGGVVTLHDQQNVVTSVNGATGDITNVAKTNVAQTFTQLQGFSAGISASYLETSPGGSITTDFIYGKSNDDISIAGNANETSGLYVNGTDQDEVTTLYAGGNSNTTVTGSRLKLIDSNSGDTVKAELKVVNYDSINDVGFTAASIILSNPWTQDSLANGNIELYSSDKIDLTTTNINLYGSALNVYSGATFTGNIYAPNIVTSVNGATGAITNVAKLDAVQTFTAVNSFEKGISASNSVGSNVLDVLATNDGTGLRIAQAASGGNSRVGSVRLGRSTTNASNILMEGYLGTFRVYNGISGTANTPGTKMLELSTTNAQFGVPIAGATFTSTAGEVSIQKTILAANDSAYLRIVATDASSNPWNSDIKGNTASAANTVHTLPSTSGTLLNSNFNSYVSSINGATGAVTNINAATVTATATNVNATRYLTFVNGAGDTGIFIDTTTTPLTYNPAGGAIGAKKVTLTTSANVITVDSAAPNVVLTDGTNISTFGVDSFAASYVLPFTISNTVGLTLSSDAISFEGTGYGYKFPSANGSNGQVLTTNGAGTLSWTTAGGAVSSVSGSGSGISVSPTTGAVIVSNTGVHSFNGLTGAIAGVSSVNGLTGAVKIGRSISVYAPTTTDNITMFYTTNALTLSNIESVIRGTGTGVTFSIKYGTDRSASGTEVVTNGINCTNTTNGLSTTSFNNATISASSFVWMTIAGVSGNPNELSVTLEF